MAIYKKGNPEKYIKIPTSINSVIGNSSSNIFGDGSDGDYEVTGSVGSIALENKQFNNLTITGTVYGEILNLKVKGLLQINGGISAVGYGGRGGRATVANGSVSLISGDSGKYGVAGGTSATSVAHNNATGQEGTNQSSANFGNNNWRLAGSEFYPGAGGGGACAYSFEPKGYSPGGDGGGRIKIFANKIRFGVSGFISANGQNGVERAILAGLPTYVRSAQGGGGSIWIITADGEFGTGKITALAGVQYSGFPGYPNGNIRIDGTYTGTTNPAVGYAGTL